LSASFLKNGRSKHAIYKESALTARRERAKRPGLQCRLLKPKDNVLLVLKFSARQLDRVEHQLEPAVAHFEQTQAGLGIAHLETEPVLFAFNTPVTEIQLSVTLNFNFRFITAGSDEADYLLHDLNLRCEPLETKYDDYMTYCQRMELENRLPSFEGFFKKAHYNSDLVFAGYQSRQDFLKDFEQKFVTSNAFKQIETFYNWVFRTMEETPDRKR
jgi:hypothetical protein